MTTKSNAGRPKSYNKDQVAKAIKDLAECGKGPSVEAVKRHLREEQHLPINPRPEGLQTMIDEVLAGEAEERTLRLIEALPSEATTFIDQACDLARRELLLGFAEGYSQLERRNALPLRELRDLLSSARIEGERARQECQNYARRLKEAYERGDMFRTQVEDLQEQREAMEKELISLRAQMVAKDEVLSMLRPDIMGGTK